MLDASASPHLPTTKKLKDIQSTYPENRKKQKPVYPNNPSAAKYPSLPGVEGARSPTRVTPARGIPEEEIAGNKRKLLGSIHPRKQFYDYQECKQRKVR